MRVFIAYLAFLLASASVAITRTVIVMHHCVRTTPFTLDGEFFPNFNNYSSRPFPEWSYPAWQCVPRGLDMIATLEAFLRDKQALALPLIKVVSDATDRDIDTSHSLLQGLGMHTFPVIPDVPPVACSRLHSPLTHVFREQFSILQGQGFALQTLKI